MNAERKTWVQTIAVPAAGLSLRPGDTLLQSVPEGARIVSFQISPAPTGNQTQTWVRLGSDLAFSGSSPPPDAIQVASGEAVGDTAYPGQVCIPFPAYVACVGSSAIIRVVTTIEYLPSGGGCSCR